MPSAGLIKAAPSCFHRTGLARPLAAHPPIPHTSQRDACITLRGGSHSCGLRHEQVANQETTEIIPSLFNYAQISRCCRSADYSSTCSSCFNPLTPTVCCCTHSLRRVGLCVLMGNCLHNKQCNGAKPLSAYKKTYMTINVSRKDLHFSTFC